ncbi:MAG: DUF4097 family beta strand repeat protein [Limnochordaceae bacterium]|nr:DUF4097 family beta strand repeat protein [Limnochordaceae bacterium]
MNRRQTVLLTLAILVGIAVMDQITNGTGLYRGYAHFVQLGRTGSGASWDDTTPRAAKEQALSGPLAAGQVLTASIPMGSVELNGVQNATSADLKCTITVYASTEAEARQYLSRVSVKLTPVASGETAGLQLRVNEPPSRPAAVRGVKVNVAGTLPSQARVDVRNGYGIVRVAGVSGPSRVNNRYAATIVRDVRGDWNVDASYSAVLVAGVQGNLNMAGNYGSADLSDISGNVEIHSNFKQTNVVNVGGNLTANLRYGGLTVDGVTGNTNVDSQYVGVAGRNAAGDVRLNASYGEVRWESIRKNVRITSRYADTTLSFVRPANHRFDVRTRFGSISDHLGLAQVETADRDEKAVAGRLGEGRYSVAVDGEYADIQLNDQQDTLPEYTNGGKEYAGIQLNDQSSEQTGRGPFVR